MTTINKRLTTADLATAASKGQTLLNVLGPQLTHDSRRVFNSVSKSDASFRCDARVMRLKQKLIKREYAGN